MRKRPPRQYPAPVQRHGDPPATEAQYLRLEEYRTTVYVNRQVSDWAKKRTKNRTLGSQEAEDFFTIYETVLRTRAEKKARRAVRST